MAFFEMPLVGRIFVLVHRSGYDIDISEGEPPPQLVVFLHEFEQFDEAVVQDLFYICRQARISSINDAAQ